MLEKKSLERAKEFNDTVNNAINHSLGTMLANLKGTRISGIPEEYKWTFDVLNDVLHVFDAMCGYIEADAAAIDSLMESNRNLEEKLNKITSKQDRTIDVLNGIRKDVRKITAKQQ